MSKHSLLIQEIENNLASYGEVACRVFHGRGQAFPQYEHINIEWYPPYLFVQNFMDIISEPIKAELLTLFERHTNIQAILIQNRSWPDLTTDVLIERSKTILPLILWSKLDNKISCQVTLGKNRNTGVFLDMRAGWKWVQKNSQGKNVLNLFSYSSIFSLFALSGGASKVINMDMSAGALKTAQKNHNYNPPESGTAAFYKRDILKSASQYSKMGPYDLIIIDPPPYQKKAFSGWKDYQKLLLRCEKCLSTNGKILACLNNPQVSQQDFLTKLNEIFPAASHFDLIYSSKEIKEVDASKGLKVVSITFPPK